MSVYDDQLAAASRTPQCIVTLGLRQCANWYAQVSSQVLKNTDGIPSGYTRTNVTIVGAAATLPSPDDDLNTATALTWDIAATSVMYRAGQSDGPDAASRAWTASVFAKTASGTGTLTLRVRDGAGGEIGSVVMSLTTTWTRFSVHKLFSGGVVGKPVWEIYRDTTDTGAEVHVWGANLSENPGALNQVVLFPYRRRDNEAEGASVQASRCQAADAGNGNRCYYSFPTCQDAAHYNNGNDYEATLPLQGTKETRFCLKDYPTPLGGEDISPYVRSVDFTPQKLDPERAVTVNERVTLSFYDDAVTHNWNQDKAADGALTNTTTPSGTYFRRFMRIHRNYANPKNYAKVRRGFVAAGMTDALFAQKGKYLINNMGVSGDGLITMELTDALRLTKRTASGTSNAKLPAKISETNTLTTAIVAGTTSLVFDDPDEIPEPDGDFTVCLELEPGTGNNEFVNVTSRPSGGPVVVTRGRWGTTAASHAAGSAFRVVLQFGTENPTPSSAPLGKNPIDIVVEILRMSGIAMADIDTTTLYDERDTWLAGSVSGTTETGILFKRCGETPDSGNGCISQQTDAEELLKQIREICMMSMWVGEDQRVTGRVFSPPLPTVTLTELTDGEFIVKGSIEVDDNEESRLTRIVVGYDIRTDAGGDKLADYQKILARVGSDEEAPGNYGDERVRQLLAPWCRVSDTATINALTAHILGRFRNSARRVSFALELKDDDIACGDFVSLTTAHIQKPDGSSDTRIMEILSKQMAPDMATIGYECMDTGLTSRYGFYSPDPHPDYDAATTAERLYGYWADDNAKVGSDFDPPYCYW